MRRHFLTLLAGALALVLSVGVGVSIAGTTQTSATDPVVGSDSLPHPLGDKQEALKQVALQQLASGKIPAGTKVGQVAKGQYVELAREGEDSIFTVLGQFGNQVNPTYGGSAGPLHNEIPQPDRTVDNTTIWASDFSQSYFTKLLFDDSAGANSMRNFYKEQSSNRYTVNGDITDWVTVPFNEANYGSNYCGSIICARTWLFVRDSLNAWYAGQIASGKTPAQVDDYLKKFDVWDRYDYDGDGNFDEPDGYIDHFQSIHAGVGEETGGGAQGTNAIWSHRWYAFFNLIGVSGPSFNKYGDLQVGGSSYWVGDYTIEPENGGVGVFSHEFAHDLGLPDEYDTSGNTGGAENGTGFWTLMSSGSYGNNGTPAEGIGNRPFHMNGWDKFQLGWLNYEVARAGEKSEHKIGPSVTNTKQAQGVFVVLPDKKVTVQLGQPYAGSHFYYSGTGDNLDTSMTRSVTLPAGANLSAKVRYNIEQDWDYAYLTVNGTPVATNLSTNTSPNGQNFGNGITGVQTGWVDLTANLSAFTGPVTIGFRYWTDGAQQGQPGQSSVPGFQIDDIAITGQALDGAESDAGWAFTPASGGFRVTTGTETQSYFNAYLAENRQYLGYDAGLKTGPYNFGGTVGPNWAERFPYQDGVLLWYWDSSFGDNNVGDHPGGGLILPIDVRPTPLHSASGAVLRARVQSFDAALTLNPTDAFALHFGGAAVNIASQPAVSVFDDTKSYWVASDPGDAPANGRYQASWNSVKTPNTGTQIQLKSLTPGGFAQVEVSPSK
jgi:immune inhibitor A